MLKNTIRLTESDLKRVISESVKKVLKETNNKNDEYIVSPFGLNTNKGEYYNNGDKQSLNRNKSKEEIEQQVRNSPLRTNIDFIRKIVSLFENNVAECYIEGIQKNDVIRNLSNTITYLKMLEKRL